MRTPIFTLQKKSFQQTAFLSLFLFASTPVQSSFLTFLDQGLRVGKTLHTVYNMFTTDEASENEPDNISNTTKEMVNDAAHTLKYAFISVSIYHFPELTLERILSRLIETKLEDASPEEACHSLFLDYRKDEYQGILRFSVIDFGFIEGTSTRLKESSNRSLYTFLSQAIPLSDRAQPLQILHPTMSQIINTQNGEEKWRKTCFYEYILSNPPPEFNRVYIRFKAWRKRTE